uniref:TGF-beta family profile domain-containing protein n=1 Tax=Setaria digitata TaxID=48799 RepID=A0A915PIV1_9BILA
MNEQPKQDKPALPVPNYVWNIYEKVKKEDIEWVRHYYPYNIRELDNSTLLLHYDLSVTVRNVTGEIISRAELKLKLRNKKDRRHIKIYEVDQRNSEIWRLIDAKFIDNNIRDYQWIEMDVTEAIRRRRPDMNRIDFAVKLSLSQLATYASTSYQPAAYSLSSSYDRKQAAALVVYIQTTDNKVRKKRKTNMKRRHQHKKHEHRAADKNYCRRTELLVDFNELNWQDWILAPSSYSAYQCQGECPNPLTSHFNTTNHAIVQGLINSVDPSLVPAPCCVPTEMESLAILYIDVEGKIVIKNYPDMEVLSCGCR